MTVVPLEELALPKVAFAPDPPTTNPFKRLWRRLFPKRGLESEEVAAQKALAERTAGAWCESPSDEDDRYSGIIDAVREELDRAEERVGLRYRHEIETLEDALQRASAAILELDPDGSRRVDIARLEEDLTKARETIRIQDLGIAAQGKKMHEQDEEIARLTGANAHLQELLAFHRSQADKPRRRRNKK